MTNPSERPNAATSVVREALSGSGLDLVASCGVDRYDASAPEAFRASAWLPGARGLIVAASSGTLLWRRFSEVQRAIAGGSNGLDTRALRAANAFDGWVAGLLDRADLAMRAAGMSSRRFDAAFGASPRVDFLALGRLVGLGAPGPFGMLIHPVHGPWWALRGAWLVDAEVDPPATLRPPCAGCAAPCIGGWQNAPAAAAVSSATPDVRGRCIVGEASRYEDGQIAYHHRRPLGRAPSCS